jgi:hypothetical protein
VTADLLGTLTVALGPVSRLDLVTLHPALKGTGLVQPFPKVVERVKRFVVGNDDSGYALMHQRLRDYMRHHPDLNVENYHHQLLDYCAHWRDHRSRYALRYYAAHLDALARPNGASVRHQETEQLVRLVLTPEFQKLHNEVVKNPAALQQDLQRALQCTALDDDLLALPLLVQSALALVDFNRTALRPEPIFQLAAAGQIEEAVDRLALFDVDPYWHRAIRLLLAWLMPQEQDHEARALRQRG